MNKNRKLKFVSIFLVYILYMQIFTTNVYEASEAPSMYSGAYALSDGNTNRILLKKNETIPMANASTTKILTCIVALENSDINDMVIVSANAQNQPKVKLGIGEGEQYPLTDLLYGLMLESYNDCAVAIAEHVAGSEEAFALLLNNKAEDIGCTDTYFITPNGLDDENEISFHHTTAADLCKMMAYCVWESQQKELFLQITQTTSYQGTNGINRYEFTNRNTFLNQMDGVLSGKTGFTSRAGYCYVAALERNGEKYCIALLACGWPNDKTYKWKDARALFDYGLKNYENINLKQEEIKECIIVDGYINDPQFLHLNRQMKISISGLFEEKEFLLNKQEKVQRIIKLNKNISLPIKKGQQLGTCSFYVGDYFITTLPLFVEDNVGEWNLWDIFYAVFRQYINF